MKILKLTLLTIFMMIISTASQAQRKKKNALKDKNEVVEKKESKGLKEYHELFPGGHKIDSGLFIVHQLGEKYYFEIPFHQLDQDILWVSRISKIPAGLGGGYLNAGSKTNEQVVHWSRFQNNIHLKSISFNNVASDTLPIFQSVSDNNYAPLIGAFKIETFNADSTAAVIDVTELFLSDIQAISGLSSALRKRYKVKSMDKKRSFIYKIQSFPENVEVRHDLTYVAGEPPENSRTGTISMQMSQSMYLLPKQPMQPRIFDKRVGWFTVSQVDFGSEKLKADRKTYIRRWRLEPKDIEAYKRGELVEPIKPIIYYLDPATPKKWRPYFKQGIEDWQVAFEAAGFKNAIVALDAPTVEENPDWSPEDARYSVVRYVANTTRNAMGPSVSDPRSGEIIESDIIWYHNHLRSYRNRYLLETGAANPNARTLETPEEEIGEMMRMVISHEVGHALGLPHNMKASFAYPTDSLRSPAFTHKWGLASTLMDYTRYNYVAQPGDGNVRWVRMLGPYDSYAINWGYRFLPHINSAEEEKPILNEWINDKKGDPMYLFGGRNDFDPSSQTESVGDDPIKASTYGLNNLKIVAENLKTWTSTENEGYEDLNELFYELLGVWSRYAGHVVTNVGGVYEQFYTTNEEGMVYTPLSKQEQKKSIQWLNNNFFTTPDWLLIEEIIYNISPWGHVKRVKSLHERQLKKLLENRRLERMLDNEAVYGNNAYTLVEMVGDLRKGIFSELNTGKNIDPFRRTLQYEFILQLGELLNSKNALSDVKSISRGELKTLSNLIKIKSRLYGDGINKTHLEGLLAQIENILAVERPH